MATPAPNTPQFPTSAIALTPSDTDRFPPSAIYVGNGGNVTVYPAAPLDAVAVTFVGIPNGGVVPVLCVGVASTSTTAAAIVRVS
jgi:hypothetical protein